MPSENGYQDYSTQLARLLENPEILERAKTDFNRCLDEVYSEDIFSPHPIMTKPQLIKEYKYDQ